MIHSSISRFLQKIYSKYKSNYFNFDYFLGACLLTQFDTIRSQFGPTRPPPLDHPGRPLSIEKTKPRRPPPARKLQSMSFAECKLKCECKGLLTQGALQSRLIQIVLKRLSILRSCLGDDSPHTDTSKLDCMTSNSGSTSH